MRCSRFASSLIPALVCLGVGCRDQEPGTASQVLSTARPGISVARVRAAYYEALYRPDYIAAVSGKPVLAASGDVWLASTEAADTLTVYYVVGRGTTNQPLRRVLLPQEMFVTDATSTHVWGVMRDEMDTPYIVGRRLVEWNRPES